MENEVSRQSLDLREDDSMGSVKIADDVVAMIAALAATEVDGVSSMNGNLTHEIMNKIGYKNLTRGVKVEVFNKKVRVDLSIIIEYGYNIPG
ncbi:MAG: Asp23/Gls24 family envelope stress response protein, partial [Lachnospiraceae bacterium]